jgi:hypothetical protein
MIAQNSMEEEEGKATLELSPSSVLGEHFDSDQSHFGEKDQVPKEKDA